MIGYFPLNREDEFGGVSTHRGSRVWKGRHLTHQNKYPHRETWEHSHSELS